MSESGNASRPVSGILAATRGIQYEHLIAGLCGGVVSTLVLHPLDLIKIRFAVDDGKLDQRPKYKGLRHAFSSIFRQEGFTGMYKGVVPNVVGAGASWGSYLFIYQTLKNQLQGGNSKLHVPYGQTFLASGAAGVLTLAITNPIWVVKTRLCLQYGAGLSAGEIPYKGMVDALYKIATQEGMKGLYKGFVPGLFGISHGAIQITVYEEMKTSFNRYRKRPIDTKLGSFQYILFSALSKAVAALSTYPYQVIRARLQDRKSQYTGTIDCVKKTWRTEGFRGFYKGLKPNLVRVVPATAITFVVYENVWHFVRSKRENHDDD